MKNIALIFSLLLSTSIFAGTPAIGDYAVYSLTTSDLPGETITMKSEIIDFDSASNQYLKRTTTTVFGNAEEEDTMVAADELSNFGQVLAYCESDMIKGRLEAVTVTAGTFNSCNISSEGTSLNIADVPFGIVKVIGPNFLMQLTSFQKL